MTLKEKQLKGIRDRIRQIERELEVLSQTLKPNSPKIWLKKFEKYVRMGFHEFTKDEVAVRAESLSFLTIFSILPLIAGAFFVFSIFSKFGMVQDTLSEIIQSVVSRLPGEHRDFVLQYVMEFKDSYLNGLEQKSGSIGVFALVLLAWVGFSFFRNINQVLNTVWPSTQSRSIAAQIQNFLVVIVGAPFVISASLSIPLILAKTPVLRDIYHFIPFSEALLNHLIPASLIFGSFTLMYRYGPTYSVKWKSAAYGAIFSTVLLKLSIALMGFYFRFGAQTAYGKAAAIPLLGYLIYFIWIEFLMGAEVSYLYQFKNVAAPTDEYSPSMADGRTYLEILSVMSRMFLERKTPMTYAEIAAALKNPSPTLHKVFEIAIQKGWIGAVEGRKVKEDDRQFTLCRDPSNIPIATLIEEIFPMEEETAHSSPIDQVWHQSRLAWKASFEEKSLVEISPI